MMAASTNGAALPLWKRVCIRAAAVLFIGLTIWQIEAQRDDWPLSSFEMYSGLQGKVASRTATVGVSDEGEFDLTGVSLGPIAGARLRHLSDRLERNPKRRARFLASVQSRYEEQRQASGLPLLQGLRTYTETWKIAPALAGIERPARRLNGSTYFPPANLLAELELERSARAPADAAREPGPGDIVFDAAPEQCEPACAQVDDVYASLGRAVVLDAKATGVLSAAVSLEAGRWRLFVRMKSEAGGPDRVTLRLDGRRAGPKTGLGNYGEWLGGGAWVWASAAPGAPPVEIEVAGGRHVLTLALEQGSVRLDQIWLSRARRELPVFNDPVKS
jgi:hypothetical protein